MKRFTLLTIASLGLVVLLGSTAHADGLDVIDWGTNCWGTSPDADSDGINDNCEYDVAYWFMPLLWFDSGESGEERRPYYAVKNLSTAGRQLKIFFMDTYYEDTGVGSGHDGDSEFQVFEVHYSSGVWYLDWVYMSAHYDTWCDSSSWYYYSSLEYETWRTYNDYRGWPTIYAAEDKHATYNNTSNCDDGCYWTDYCSKYFEQYLDQWAWLASRNVGNRTYKLINYVYYNGESEYLLNDTDFAGWDDNWYRSNSGGYWDSLGDFGY